MLKLDQETYHFILEAEDFWRRQRKNIEYLLECLKEDNSNDEILVDKIVGVNILAVGTELLTIQILKNLKESCLLMSLIAMRALLENYINVHYIFHHPRHLRDRNWAKKVCKDYFERTFDPRSKKSHLGELPLRQRAREVNLEAYYEIVYSDLCNYTHFLADVSDHVIDEQIFKYRTIQVATYVVTMYQDILAAIASFFNSHLDIFVDELSEYRKNGKMILASIQSERQKQYGS